MKQSEDLERHVSTVSEESRQAKEELSKVKEDNQVLLEKTG